MNSFIQENTHKDIGLLEMINRIEPLCSLGRDMKARMMPFLPGREKELNKELDRVSYCRDIIQHKKKLAAEIESVISHVKDIRGSLKRANAGIALDVVELYEIKNFLFQLNELNECLHKLDLDISVTPVKQLEELLDPEKTRRRTFYIENSYSRRLKWIREQKKSMELNIKEERDSLQNEIENTFGYKINPRGEIVIGKGGTEQLISKMKDSSNLVYLRENFSSVIFAPRPSKALTELEDKLMKFKLKEEEEEYNIRKKLTADIARYFEILMKNSENIGTIDLLFAKAKLGFQVNGVKPQIQSGQRICIKGGRHPIVEENLKKRRLGYTPIDIDLNNSVILITGVNMGGKTATLKMVGLLTAMAQYGLLVPADSMEFSLRNFIFLSGSSGESLAEGLSAFGAEIKSIGETIKRKDDIGLVLIDELARGTNPPEGIAIASAVIETFKKRSSITVITTHFHELSRIPGIVHLQVKGLLDVDLTTIKTNIGRKGILGVEALNSLMDYRLLEVKGETPPPRDAIKVARLMGFDEDTLNRAEEFLN